MEATAQRETDLHSRVGNELRAIGQPDQTVPENEKPVFKVEDLAEVLGNVVAHPLEDAFSGKEGLERGNRASPGGRFGRWVLDRFKRKQK